MLRLLGDDELEALLGLYAHLHSRDQPVEASIAKERWQQMQVMPGHQVLGFYHDDGLIGSCVLQIVPNLSRGARPYAVMENVVVHPDHRRRGVGTTMVRQTLERAWATGCYKVMLLTGVDNKHTKGFYEAAGFDGREKQGYVARPPGR